MMLNCSINHVLSVQTCTLHHRTRRNLEGRGRALAQSTVKIKNLNEYDKQKQTNKQRKTDCSYNSHDYD